MIYPIDKFKTMLNGLNNYFDLSDLAYHKFVVGLTKNTIYNCDMQQLAVFKNTDIIKKNKIKIYFVLYFQLFKLLIKMLLASFFIKLFFRNNVKYKNKTYLFVQYSKKADYVNFLNNNKINYTVSLIPSLRSIRVYMKIRKTPTMGTFDLNYRIITGILSYLKYYGVSSSSFLYSFFDLKSIKKFNDIIFKSFYYNEWAKQIASMIKKSNQNLNVIVENDNGGPLLFLVEKLNSLHINTIHVQHGAYSSNNIFYIPPLCKKMLCCSEREKQIQIINGTNEKNLSIFGAPYQTLHDSVYNNNNNNSIFDILIIGGGGPKISQQENISFLSSINSILKKHKLLLRTHPSNKSIENKLWVKTILINESVKLSKDKKLKDDILQSEFILCFSIDALISCIRNKKKTIYYISKYDKKAYEFLSSIPNVKIVSDVNDFRKAINELVKISQSTINSYYSQNENEITYMFGENRIDKVSENFINSLHKLSK